MKKLSKDFIMKKSRKNIFYSYSIIQYIIIHKTINNIVVKKSQSSLKQYHDFFIRSMFLIKNSDNKIIFFKFHTFKINRINIFIQFKLYFLTNTSIDCFKKKIFFNCKHYFPKQIINIIKLCQKSVNFFKKHKFYFN
jgi:hypothetical protein